MINLPPESEEEQEDSFLSERLIDLYIKHWHRGSVGVRGGLQSIWSLDTQAYFLIQARTKRNLQTFPSLVGAGGEVKVVGVTPTSLYSSVHMKCGGDTTVSIQTNQRPVYKWTQLSGFCFSYKEWANHNINKPGYYDHIEPMKVLTKKRQIF